MVIIKLTNFYNELRFLEIPFEESPLQSKYRCLVSIPALDNRRHNHRSRANRHFQGRPSYERARFLIFVRDFKWQKKLTLDGRRGLSNHFEPKSLLCRIRLNTSFQLWLVDHCNRLVLHTYASKLSRMLWRQLNRRICRSVCKESIVRNRWALKKIQIKL